MIKNTWQRSILFEIINKNAPASAVEAYTLAIPPESIEITQPQRVSRTKTFGGVFEDDYGIDNAKIVISGTTGGVDVRDVYRGDFGMEKMTGKTAVFAFRDRIIRYKTNPNIRDYYNYEIRMYDLSAMPQIMFDERRIRPTGLDAADSWVVSLDDFKISRSKDQPLFYKYSIELFGIRPMGQFIPSTREVIPSVGKRGIPSLIENIQGILNDWKDRFARLRTVTNEISAVIDATESLLEQVVGFVNQTGDLIRYPASFAKQVLGLVTDLSQTIYNIPSDWAAYWEDAWVDDWEDVVLQVEELLSGAAFAVAYGKTAKVAVTETVSLPELQSDVQKALTGFASDDNNVSVYGYTSTALTSTDTLESLAQKYYGDPSYAQLIASYNEIGDDDELSAGQRIKIPAIVPVDRTDGGNIYDYDLNDPYGRDIAVGESGDVLFGESGEYATVGGVENVIQAINMRLGEVIGNRLRLTSYGLVSNVGSTIKNQAVVVYLISNLRETVMQDPRVARINGISLQGSRDTITFSIDLDLVGNNPVRVVGAI